MVETCMRCINCDALLFSREVIISNKEYLHYECFYCYKFSFRTSGAGEIDYYYRKYEEDTLFANKNINMTILNNLHLKWIPVRLTHLKQDIDFIYNRINKMKVFE